MKFGVLRLLLQNSLQTAAGDLRYTQVKCVRYTLVKSVDGLVVVLFLSPHANWLVARLRLSAGYARAEPSLCSQYPFSAFWLPGGVVPSLRGLRMLPPAGGSIGKSCGTRPSSPGASFRLSERLFERYFC